MPRKSAVRARARANALQVLDFKFDLVQQRKHLKLTQTDVAERMGVRQATVAELEKHDSNPTLRTIERYANAVDATIELAVNDDCGPETHTAFREIMSGAASPIWLERSASDGRSSRGWRKAASNVRTLDN